jgi:hypothetical protein
MIQVLDCRTHSRQCDKLPLRRELCESAGLILGNSARYDLGLGLECN